MPIRQRIIAHECVEQFEKSADERYEEGVSLLAVGLVGGMNSLCLASEMILKASYFRYAGFPNALPIQIADRQDVTTLARNRGIQYQGDLQHNLRFWVEAIIAARNNGFALRNHPSGTVLPAVAVNPITAHEVALRLYADTLRDNSIIGDRYLARQGLMTPQDTEAVFDASISIQDLYKRNVL